MEFIGILKSKTNERSGEGRNGYWQINTYLLETVEMYPKHMVVDVSNNIELWDMLLGKTVVVKFGIDAHEYGGRWFNDIRAFDIKENTESEQQKRQRRWGKPTGEIVNAAPEEQPTEQ